jgi:hypothetical protein
MTRARQNANISPAVGRNMIINGAMNVAQRSASVTGIGAAAGYFTCDRWQIATAASAGRLTMTQTADGPNGISANCIKLDCTTADASIAAGEYLLLRQQMEGQNLQRTGKGVVGAKQITVSFYVKASAAFTFGCELYDTDHNRQITKLYDTTTDWVRHELTFPADVDDGSSPFADDNGTSLILEFWLHAGSTFSGGTLNTTTWADQTPANRAAGIDSFYSSTDNNFFITGVQMEVGPVATDFEQEEISTTLAKCQRYFQTVLKAYGVVHSCNTSGNVYANINFVSKMRAAPSITMGAANTGALYEKNANRGVSAFTAQNIQAENYQLHTQTSGATAGSAAHLDISPLFYQADAEL